MSNPKSNARKAVVQAIYQWQMTGQGLLEIEKYFQEEGHLKDAQKNYFKELLHGIPAKWTKSTQR